MRFPSFLQPQMPTKESALPGRDTPMEVPERHFVLGTPLKGPFEGAGELMVGMGCFWGAERRFWEQPGVISTAVGYSGGYTKNPTYQEVCSGRTGHNEVVRVIYDREQTDLSALLRVFWESHDPTQGMRQGNDVGTQYRSGIYLANRGEVEVAEASREAFQRSLKEAGFGRITTEIAIAGPFYFAEASHQQYLAKNPGGYCGLGGTGVSCPVGLVQA